MRRRCPRGEQTPLGTDGAAPALSGGNTPLVARRSMLQRGADGIERYLMLDADRAVVDPSGPASPSRASELRFLAFYLPQFHPIPENDEWWGPGFTDWTNVVRARPLVRGHYQPHVPADLGFYDLRLAEARAAQAAMAAEYGIDGFCYYHYWFDGRRLLERPFDEVLRSGQPDFPFCLCWANENWTRRWSGRDGEVLVRQTYSERDDLTHIRWLAEAFSDPRYLRIRGRPVFLVYRAASIPDAVQDDGYMAAGVGPPRSREILTSVSCTASTPTGSTRGRSDSTRPSSSPRTGEHFAASSTEASHAAGLGGSFVPVARTESTR